MANDLAEGTLFAGRYRIIRRIAAGGMGAVYEVEHIETDRRRALKVMHAHLFQSEDLRERFKREAKITARVESEFIVDVFDAGIDDATRMPFLVMELLRGEELGHRLKRAGKLTPAEVVTCLQQVALALDKTHQVSIVHRDLKPANIFLTEREDGALRVKILDFGIAKIVAEGATTSGATQLVGTPIYMAPEQFNPLARLTGAADIFALGMMAYTLLVGTPYWAEEAKAGNVMALMAVAIHGPCEPASGRAAKTGVFLPPAFDAWFAAMTSVDPTQRFPTATAAVNALALALGLAPPIRGAMSSRVEVTELLHPLHTEPVVALPIVIERSNAPAVMPMPVSLVPPNAPIPIRQAFAGSRNTEPAPLAIAAVGTIDATALGAAATKNLPAHPSKRSMLPLFISLSAVIVVLIGGGMLYLATGKREATNAATNIKPAMPAAETAMVVPSAPPAAPSETTMAMSPPTTDPPKAATSRPFPAAAVSLQRPSPPTAEPQATAQPTATPSATAQPTAMPHATAQPISAPPQGSTAPTATARPRKQRGLD